MKRIICLYLVSLVFFSSKAQLNYYNNSQEVGVSLGLANYLGDLGRDGVFFFGEFEPRFFRPAGGFYYRNNFSNFTSIRAGLTISQIRGDDAVSGTAQNGRLQRNLHFKSNLADVVLMFEWNILPYQVGHYKHKVSPYLGVGIAGYFYNPKAELNGEWVALQPLGTEGQGLLEYPNRTKYDKIGFALPFSAGLKINVSRRIALNLEFSYRYTFNDYLDDVSTVYPNLDYYENNYIEPVANEAVALSYRSTEEIEQVENIKRGSSEENDAYFFFLINLSFNVGKQSKYCPSFR